MIAALAVIGVTVTVPLAQARSDQLRIPEIQGPTTSSSFEGDNVAGVVGVVTGVDRFGSARGFWFQDPRPDDDPRRSSGMFVYTGDATPDVELGDEVVVAGTVDEYRPGGAESAHRSVTQIVDATWEVRATGLPLPDPEFLDADTLPTTLAPRDDDGTDRELHPDDYTVDFFESRESMRLAVQDPRVVGPSDDFGALWITVQPDQNPTHRGGTVYNSYDEPNTGRLRVESLIPFDDRPFPDADVGDELRGPTMGPLHYSEYGGYGIRATTLGDHVSGDLTPTVAEEQRDWELSIATYNVENLGGTDAQSDFDRHASGIVDQLRAPDIVSLVEIQSDSGSEDDGVVTAEETLDRLVRAIADSGGPDYAWRQIDPVDGADGGQPGGNIRNAFLFRPQRVDFVDAPGGDASTPVEVVQRSSGTHLSVSPGRITPNSQVWENSRKPLVGQFEFEGRAVFVVGTHFTAKVGDGPLYGIRQPPEQHSAPQRHGQADAVREFTDTILDQDPAANVIVAGDLNDFEFSETMRVLTVDGGLYNPMAELDPQRRYTYVFDGNAQALDHVLTSRNLAHRIEFEPVRINAEFADQASDHDPLRVRFRPRSGDGAVDISEDDRYYDGAQPPPDDELDALVPSPAHDATGVAERPAAASAVTGVVLAVAAALVWWIWRRWSRRDTSSF
ncbi:endonuclease/exonuclease/phosphatase family protein [Lipingzhangella sp. LS1_29]|uniref:Endonuclease/exonuclease/phosphatase family protein n=1 Tax=Lipingzhangella rawalii TaxID=2055835 RepID=A0ABU2HBE9_9ACTN|nr:endonuclease/exonuclease/phosphatase family protein [Lipingzhangella rawalii]MDS1272623.1 endonuclease/exonuclease/phosphatase family protein [Lipingzhangella rawalii]